MTRPPNLQLLSMEDALAAAERILASPTRNCQRVSTQETVSLAVGMRQLHEVAIAAAALCRLGPKAAPSDSALAQGELAGLLVRAGLLRLEDIKGLLPGGAS